MPLYSSPISFIKPAAVGSFLAKGDNRIPALRAAMQMCIGGERVCDADAGAIAAEAG